MLKSNLILGIISLLMFFGLIGEPVSVVLNMPDSAKCDSEFLVEVTINKGDVEGFARFQQKLPNGFKAVARQTANGEFSFVDQKVKIQWMKVPYDRQIVVSYAIQVDPTVSGTYTFDGTFSYILDNSVQVANVESKTVNIEGDAIASANSQQAYSFQNVNLKNVDCIRQKPFLNDNNEVIVNIMVNKGDLKDFGKIQEQIPVGYTAESIKSKNSIFTYKNHIIKFLWMNMPQEPQFVVSYKLVPEGEIPDEEFKIVGTFSYAESDRTKTINIAERNVELETFDSEQVIAQETPTFEPSEPIATTTTKPEPIYTSEPTYTPTPSTQPTQSSYTSEPSYSSENQNNNYADANYNSGSKTNQGSSSKTNQGSNSYGGGSGRPHNYTTTISEVSDVPSPEQGVAFRVQIAAGHKLVTKNYFKRLNITDQVQVEIHNGWNKYTVGNFEQYKDARDYRVYVWNNTPIHDAFVSAYNNGMRITVQEALMIANQKWYK